MEEQKVTAEALSTDGRTVCRVEGEDRPKKVFIPGLVPGEAALINGSELIQITSKSPARIVPPCRYFDECGGCDYQFMTTQKQRAEKFALLKFTISFYYKVAVGEFVDLSAESPEFYYRHKAKFKVIGDQIGFHNKKTHSLVAIDHCMLLNKEINQQLQPGSELRAKVGRADGLREFSIFSDARRGEVKDSISAQTSESRTENFVQVNPAGNELLKELVATHTAPKLRITEYYAGSGNFTFLLAEQAAQVTAIELNSQLVNAARTRIKLDKITNVKFLKQKAEVYARTAKHQDLALLDPPRAGAKAVVSQFDPAMTPTVIYVSCNLVTLGRDLLILASKGYVVERIYFVDMFAQTKHLELVAILKSA